MNSSAIRDKLDSVIPLISPELKARLERLQAENDEQRGWISEIGFRILKTVKENLDKSPEEIVLLIEAWV